MASALRGTTTCLAGALKSLNSQSQNGRQLARGVRIGHEPATSATEPGRWSVFCWKLSREVGFKTPHVRSTLLDLIDFLTPTAKKLLFKKNGTGGNPLLKKCDRVITYLTFSFF